MRKNGHPTWEDHQVDSFLARAARDLADLDKVLRARSEGWAAAARAFAAARRPSFAAKAFGEAAMAAMERSQVGAGIVRKHPYCKAFAAMLCLRLLS